MLPGHGVVMVEKWVAGGGDAHIILQHIMPNLLPLAFLYMMFTVTEAIALEATLSFLGVGVPPTQPSLGTLIRIGNEFLFSGFWWISIFPALTLVTLVLAVNIMGDWLRDVLDPRLIRAAEPQRVDRRVPHHRPDRGVGSAGADVELPGEPRRVVHGQCARVGRVEQVLGELGRQAGEFFLDFLEARLLVFGQFGAGQAEVAQFVVDDLLLRSRQRGITRAGLERLELGEQRFVLSEVVISSLKVRMDCVGGPQVVPRHVVVVARGGGPVRIVEELLLVAPALALEPRLRGVA